MPEDAEAEAYLADLAEGAGTPALRSSEIDAVLRLTKVVAHTSERRFAPLTAYVAALTLGERDEAQRIAVLEALTTTVRERSG